MPLDTSIALQARAPTDPLDSYGKALSLKSLLGQQQMQQMQLQQAQEDQQAQRTLADLYRTNIGSDGQVNRQGLLQAAADRGLGARIPTLQKGFADADKATADVAHTGAQTDELKVKVAKQKLDASGAALSSLLSRPSVTHDDVIGTIQGLVSQGMIDPTQGAQMVRALPGRPEALRPFLLQKGLEVMDASKRLDLLTPKAEVKDTGGGLQSFQTNQLTGEVTPGAVVARKTATPGELLTASTARRGQDLTDARTRESTSATMTKPFEVTGPDGTPMLVQQDKQGNISPVQGFGPKAGAAKPLNDSQAKALLFGSRMRDSDKILTDLSSKGVNTPSLIKQGAEAVPLIGGALGSIANSTVASPDQQSVEQAQRDFVNAVLRRESGAAIAPTEFDSAKKQYFPAVGDSAQVKAQKAQNRQLAIQGLLAEVPAGQRNTLGTAAAAATAPDASGVPPDIAAILQKHGGK